MSAVLPPASASSSAPSDPRPSATSHTDPASPDRPLRTRRIADATQRGIARGGNSRPWWRSTVLPWLLPVLLIAAWQFLSSTGRLPASVLPAPLDVVRAAWALAQRGELQRDILVSLRRVAIGFFSGAVAGLALGFIVGLSTLAHDVLDRSLQMVRTIPHLALVPLMILWFGIGEEPRVLLVAMGSLFPVYINTVSGIRNVDPKLVELGRSYGLGPLGLVATVVFPAALPAILTGIRYALGVAWLTLVVGETIASRDGIGYLVQNARELLRTDIILLAIALYAIAGWLADALTRAIERRLLRWHPNYAKGAAA
ncbi:ABC transporter permease subunit [Variovorax sp. Sphag1AA]|uniref:ABC transporter permease subunit n=1 Tax=Variovorax sp. Sphag1AA TaxID=2587027 RepID=UPI00160D3ADC|nr:ABC transporter permease subunit [Variovorax sp. Sphag1AA]MBB3181454.1 sulfonate transport system permease protein [Variovorax sp. Sphag1AA]